MSVKTISLVEMQQFMQHGKALNLIDVRTAPEFTALHAVGARSMPLDELNPPAIAALRAGPQDPVYVICQMGGRAAKACQQLEDAGITPVYNVDGGTSAWERAGLPVVRGKGGVISIERQVRIGAGAIVLLGLLLAITLHPLFLIIPAFVGAGLVFAGVTDYCGMGMLLCKMPWNRGNAPKATIQKPA